MSAGHTELRQCPFCGGEAKWVEDTGAFNTPFGLVVDHAATCYLSSPILDDEALLTAWNTRAIEAAEADLLGKALEAARKAKRELENGNGEVMSIIAAMSHLDAILSQAREVK